MMTHTMQVYANNNTKYIITDNPKLSLNSMYILACKIHLFKFFSNIMLFGCSMWRNLLPYWENFHCSEGSTDDKEWSHYPLAVVAANTCHKQGKEAEVNSKPGVNYKPLQVVQPKSEKEIVKLFRVRGIHPFLLFSKSYCHWQSNCSNHK